MDVNEIMTLIPHRAPMLLIEEISDYVRGEYAVGHKNVSINEPFFQGHFPKKPIMPGVLIIEALAQLGCVLLSLEAEKPLEKMPLFMSIEQAKFRAPVLPGDRLDLRVEIISLKRGIAKVKATASVSNKVVTEAELLLMLK